MKYVNPNRDQSAMTATPEKYPQGKFSDKECRRCSKTFSPKAPSHLYCSQDCADLARTDRYLNRAYDLSVEDYDRMFEEQGGLCCICEGRGFLMTENHKVLLVVDHNHTTGEVRGLLCHNCNRALGLLKDDVKVLKKAIEYLERATTIPKGSRA